MGVQRERRRHHVVVIGGGFGGLAVVRSLRREPVDVTLVDANNFHTFQPLLYQVATAGLDAGDVAHPIRGAVRGRRRGRVEVVMARVVAIDVAAHGLTLADGTRIGYDTLVVAAGAVSTDFGVPGVERHALPLKTLDDAIALRRRVLSSFELAARHPERVAPGALDVVVCGGGPTGVEMAGGLAELYARVLAVDFPTLAVGRARIVLVEAADRLLPPFSPASSADAAATLTRLGVEVRVGVGIERVGPTAVALTDGSSIPAATCVWAAGVRAHPLAESLGVELARGGRIPVDGDLSVPGCADVFAIGDIAAVRDESGELLAQVAQPAIQGGRHVGAQIAARLRDEDTRPFRYVDKGSMATIGRHSAVTELPGGRRFSGVAGWVAWLALHLVYLMGFRNRITVFVNWCWNYVTFDRASRLLSERELVDRTAATSMDGESSGRQTR